jgi:hypothetical protein
MDLERTHVHPIFYELALEIAQLKTRKKGAAAISAFQRERNPPVLSHQEVESVFESDASAKLVQVAPYFLKKTFHVRKLIRCRISDLSQMVKLGNLSRLFAAPCMAQTTNFLPLPQCRHTLFLKS